MVGSAGGGGGAVSAYAGPTPPIYTPKTPPGARAVTHYDMGASTTWGMSVPVSAGIRRLPSYPIWLRDYMTFTYAKPATGDIVYTINPSDGDTVSIGGFTGTFRLMPGLPGEIQIGAEYWDSVTNAVNTLNDYIKTIRFTTSGADIYMTYWQTGTIGNSTPFSASTPGCEFSGGTLSGGTDAPTLATFAISFGYPLDPTNAAGRVVRQIWADGRLVWYAPAGAQSGSVPGSVLSTADEGFSFVFYPGSETQLQDPTMVGDEGAANTPAYRGMMYMVITDFPLTEFQCHIPSISAEIADQQYNQTSTDTDGNVADLPMDVAVQLHLLCNGQPWNYNGIVDAKLDFGATAFYPSDPQDMSMTNSGIIIDQDWKLADVLNAYAAFYDFNFAESGFGLKFTKVQTAGAFEIAAVIQEASLVDDGNLTGGCLQTTRADQGGIPTIMTVSYYDVSQQYQLSIQRARRQQFPQQTVFSTASQDFKVPVVCTATQALTGCMRALYRAAHARVFHQFTLPPNFLYLEPGDVVQINRATGKRYFAQITYCEIQADLSIMVTAVNVAYNKPGNPIGYGGQNILVTITSGAGVGGVANASIVEPLAVTGGGSPSVPIDITPPVIT